MQQITYLVTIIEAFIFRLLHKVADVLLIEASADSSIDNVLELFFVKYYYIFHKSFEIKILAAKLSQKIYGNKKGKRTAPATY
jgi:hypothetical protein